MNFFLIDKNVHVHELLVVAFIYLFFLLPLAVTLSFFFSLLPRA